MPKKLPICLKKLLCTQQLKLKQIQVKQLHNALIAPSVLAADLEICNATSNDQQQQ
jgi:hypothetical protein